MKTNVKGQQLAKAGLELTQVLWDSRGVPWTSSEGGGRVLAPALHFCRDPELVPGKLAPQLAV